MKNLILVICLVFFGLQAKSHNPLTAKFELAATNHEAALLNIYLSQTGLHQALTKHYSNVDFSTITDKSYKELAISYIKEHTTLAIRGHELKLGEGGIKLSNHQTDLKFIIESYPTDAHQIEVKIDAFRENKNHHTMFWWTTKYGKTKLILSKENDYKGSLNQSVTSYSLSSKNSTSFIWILVSTGILAIIVLMSLNWSQELFSVGKLNIKKV